MSDSPYRIVYEFDFKDEPLKRFVICLDPKTIVMIRPK